MPFIEQSIMSQRIEFCILASKPGSEMSDLCHRFNIARRTGYKWLQRYLEKGLLGLKDKSRRPDHFPNQTAEEIDQYIVGLRKADPEWGAKKLHRILMTHKERGLYTYSTVPCKNTITKILKRNDLITPNRSKQSEGFERFEHDYPNELWQMDFKGYFRLLNKEICHPLTITDDHSRYNICLQACKNQQEITVRQALINVFRRYGIPFEILTDHGSPWGTTGNDSADGIRSYTALEKWLIQLNIKLIHGRAY